MDLALTNLTYRHHHQPSSTDTHHRRATLKSITFPKLTAFSSLQPIKSSFQNPNFITPNHHIPKISKPNPNQLSFFKSAIITGVTIAAVFLSRPSLAAPISQSPPPPPAVTETTDDEQTLNSNPKDTDTIKALIEVKIKNGNVHEAIGLLNQLINLKPEDSEWQLLKYHLQSYGGDHESAKLGFESILSKDPLRVEAYYGLVISASAKESPETELKNVENQILEGMEICKKTKKKDEITDFKLLLAQIRVMQGEYDNALTIYQQLSKDEPRDFRPYLCQGIIYTMLEKNDVAETMFGKYRKLVPKGHPYTKYFDDNLVATKGFAENVESERALSKS